MLAGWLLSEEIYTPQNFQNNFCSFDFEQNFVPINFKNRTVFRGISATAIRMINSILNS